jgi:hypothetical protein
MEQVKPAKPVASAMQVPQVRVVQEDVTDFDELD